jgi:hypothetical protein
MISEPLFVFEPKLTATFPFLFPIGVVIMVVGYIIVKELRSKQNFSVKFWICVGLMPVLILGGIFLDRFIRVKEGKVLIYPDKIETKSLTLPMDKVHSVYILSDPSTVHRISHTRSYSSQLAYLYAMSAEGKFWKIADSSTFDLEKIERAINEVKERSE